MKPVHMLMALMVAVIWGGNFVAAKLAATAVPPLFLVAMRFTVLTAVLAPFVPWPGARWRGVFGIAMSLGVCHFGLLFAAMGLGIDAGTMSVAIQLEVPMAAFLASFMLGDSLGWRRILGMALAVGGVMLLANEPKVLDNLDALLIGLVGALAWAVANIQIKRLGTIDAQTLNAWMGPFAVPVLLLLSFLIEDGQVEAVANIEWLALGSFFYIVVASSLIAYGSWYYLLARYPVSQVTIFALLVPVFAILAGMLFLGEQLGMLEAVGALLTLTGVAIVQIRRPRLAAQRL